MVSQNFLIDIDSVNFASVLHNLCENFYKTFTDVIMYIEKT